MMPLAGLYTLDVVDTRPTSTERTPPERALLGAESPDAGRFVVLGGAGMVFMLPYATAGARLGLGAGTRVSLHYENLSGLGHTGGAHVGWGHRISRDIAVGALARTSIRTLAQADGGLIGIQFSNIALGNDWEAGGDAVLTWLRAEQAHLTFELGATTTLGGVRYQSFEDSSFVIEPAFRSIDFAIQGEWRLRPTFDVFVRLDGMVLVNADIMPLGFLPTATTGFAWAP
jgi:hypothetical protein